MANPLSLNYGSIALATAPGLSNCEKCKMKAAEGGALEGRGKGTNGIMMIGESPDSLDVKEGAVFSGAAGKYLSYVCEGDGIKLDDCRLTNLIQCYPGRDTHGKLKKPTVGAVRLCLPRLIAEIYKYKPKMIFMLGDNAVKGLFPQHTLARMHGKRWQVGSVTYVAMYHPSAGLHSLYLRTLIQYDWENLFTVPILQEITGDYRIDDDSHFGKPLELTLDTELTGLEKDAAFIGGSLSPAPGKACYYTSEDKFFGAIKRLKPFMLKGHNLKFDLERMMLRGFNIDSYQYEDTMHKAYCMGYEDLRLKSLETQELNLWHPSYESVVGKAENLTEIDVKVVANYCCQDSDSTARLDEHFGKASDERERSLYNRIEKPLLPAIAKMEMLGIRVDLDYVKEWDKQLVKKYEKESKLLAKEYGLTDETLDSPKQLGEWLKTKGIKLPKTESGLQFATGKEILAGHIDKHPAIAHILQRRQYEKQRTTYAGALLKLTGPDGLLHATYNQANTATGRTSASNPNMQNQPHTFEARRPFIARPGNKLMDIDYSQIDMRVLAHFSHDKRLLEAFAADIDVHNMMADMLFGDHSPEHRYLVKSASYMMLYMGSPRGLFVYMNAPMGEFNVLKMGKPPTEEDCERHLQHYYEEFPGIRTYQESTIQFAHDNGYVEDYYGRRRYLPALASNDKGERKAAERQAVNLPIAGTAGAIFKLAIINTAPILTPVIHVHDELAWDLPEKDIPKYKPLLEHAMLDIDFPVKLKVKTHIADNLGEMVAD
jgi:DNA polymerase-1